MSWDMKSLDELGYVSRGRSRHRPRDAAHLYDGPYPFIQTADVKHANLYINDFTQTYSEAGLAQSRLWHPGTLCITIAANIADTAILNIDACFPDSVIGFIPDPKKADARFIKYLFDALLQRRYKTFTQGAAQDNLSQSKLLSLNFRVPSINEQVSIADNLCAYDDLIENNQRRIYLLEQAMRLLYEEWFVNFRFPGHEHVKNIDGVPEGWKMTTIGACFNTILGGTPSRKNPAYWGGDVPWINSGEVNKLRINSATEFITEKGLTKSAAKLMPSGTTVLAITGATLGQVSRLEMTCSANQSVVGIYDDNEFNNEWIYLFFVHEIRRIINQATGGAQQHINKEIVKATNFVQPPHQIIDAFRQIVLPVFAQIRNVGLQNILLTKARDLLLPKLMNGEVAV